MKISDLIRELQEIQDRDGDIPVNIVMNGFENGDMPIIHEKEDEFTFYNPHRDGGPNVLFIEGDSRDLDSRIDDGMC